MSTATEDRTDIEEGALLVQTAPNAMFKSKRKGLRLTMTPRYPVRDGTSGQMTGKTKGVFVAFREGADGGYLSFPETGTVKLVDSLDGGESEIEAEQLLEWLEGHRLFGNLAEGFWREEIEAPAVSREELQALMDAAMALDDETLRRIIEQEERGWKRPDVLETARGALERIEAVKLAAQEGEREAQAAAAAANVELEQARRDAEEARAEVEKHKAAAAKAKATAKKPAANEEAGEE